MSLFETAVETINTAIKNVSELIRQPQANNFSFPDRDFRLQDSETGRIFAKFAPELSGLQKNYKVGDSTFTIFKAKDSIFVLKKNSCSEITDTMVFDSRTYQLTNYLDGNENKLYDTSQLGKELIYSGRYQVMSGTEAERKAAKNVTDLIDAYTIRGEAKANLSISRKKKT